ncbi:MAG: response regulator [Verrucomicrobiales bacterium]|nr:response regulator [Verrucomicrobiales bacterium]
MLHSTILLAEDNEDDIILMQRAFTKARLANPLRVVHDGGEAIRYLSGTGSYADRAKNPVPLMLLLDLHLPMMDGFEVLRWLRDQPQLVGVIVVVLTSSTDQRDFTRARELGAHSYFTKPGGLDELVKLMIRVQGYWLLLDQRPPEFPVTIDA